MRTSRIIIALGFLAALAIGGGGFLIGRNMAPPSHPVAAPTPAPALAPPKERPLLGRRDFISLAAKAADASASGEAVPQDVLNAVGRRFDLVLPLGCPAPDNSSLSGTNWSYDKDRSRLRISIPPVEWKATDWNLDEEAKVEAIEGFWIARPWSSSTGCPPPLLVPASGQPSDARTSADDTEEGKSVGKNTPVPANDEGAATTPSAPPVETLAVAQFVTPESTSSIRRAGRPFDIVTRVTPDQIDASRGFRIRLTGRIEQVPGGAPIQCIQPSGREHRPQCVIAAVLDDVKVENAATGAVLATWSASHSSR